MADGEKRRRMAKLVDASASRRRPLDDEWKCTEGLFRLRRQPKTETWGERNFETISQYPLYVYQKDGVISRTLVQFPDGVCYWPEPRSCHELLLVVVARFVGVSSCTFLRVVISLLVVVPSIGRNPPRISSRTFSRIFLFSFSLRFLFHS